MQNRKISIIRKLAMALLAAVALSNQSLAADIVLTPPAGGAVAVTAGGVKFPDGTIQATAATPPCFDLNNRYKDCGDGTVFDKTTGLMWEKKLASTDAACTSATQSLRNVRCQQNAYTWSAGITAPDGTLYTDFLAKLNLDSTNDPSKTCFANHCDWRLPTIVELRSILLAPFPCGSNPCIDAIFGPTQASNYWSSSSLASNPSLAWFVFFGNGTVNGVNKNFDSFARAVRSGR